MKCMEYPLPPTEERCNIVEKGRAKRRKKKKTSVISSKEKSKGG
jgi:hypothetical protein